MGHTWPEQSANLFGYYDNITFLYSGIWDGFLEGHIKLHKPLVLSNQLPPPDTAPLFLANDTLNTVNNGECKCVVMYLWLAFEGNAMFELKSM